MLKKENLHPYQLKTVDHILNNSRCGVFLDMGMGKTVSTLTAIDVLSFDNFEIDTTLVIAPKRVAETVWMQETLKWAHLNHLKVVVVKGTPTQRWRLLNSAADIHVIGRDNVAWMCGMFGGSRLPFDMLVIDELSSFKNPNAVKFKALRKVIGSFKRVVGLTGTPAPNGLLDLWSQMYLIDMGKRLGKFLTHYRTNYFTAGARNGEIVYKYQLRKGASDMIHDLISDICISMKLADYVNLPDKIENIVEITLPENIQDLYKEFEREKILEMFEDENVEITAVNAGALANKLLQFSNGAVYDDLKNWHEVHKLKIEALKEIVEEANGNPILIAYSYKHDLARILKALKAYKPVVLDTEDDVNAWNAGEIQVLITHPQSAGHGLNLQYGGNRAVWFGPTWSLELDQQFNARLYRQGQLKPTLIYRLVCKNTIDENVIQALKTKDRTQEALISAVKVKIQKYLNRR